MDERNANGMIDFFTFSCYQFPPLGSGDVTADEMRGNELQVIHLRI